MVTISDASFCQETEHHDGVTQHCKSQQAYITLAPGDALNADEMILHPLCWRSARIRKVRLSTLMAEAFALSNGVEHGLRLRAALVDVKAKLNIRR